MNAVVYVLREPNTERVRYVGQTIDPVDRLKRHLRPRAKDKTYRANWIRSLLAKGQAPLFEIIEQCDAEAAYIRERFWISYYQICGSPLVNASDGGPGLKNPPAEVRARKSASLMGHAVSDDTRRAVSLAHKGKPLSEAQRVKLSAAGKGRISEKRGTTLSDEHRAKVSASLVGNQRRKGIPHDEQTKAKMSAAGRGKPKSPEHRAKLSAAARLRWAKVKQE